jgi:hypothetical protein
MDDGRSFRMRSFEGRVHTTHRQEEAKANQWETKREKLATDEAVLTSEYRGKRSASGFTGATVARSPGTDAKRSCQKPDEGRAGTRRATRACIRLGTWGDLIDGGYCLTQATSLPSSDRCIYDRKRGEF